MTEDELLATKRVGSTIGDWSIERLLGAGAMGAVFAGKRRDGVTAALQAKPQPQRLCRLLRDRQRPRREYSQPR